MNVYIKRLLLVALMLLPISVSAKENNDFQIISTEEKFYKTVIFSVDSLDLARNDIYTTSEISEEEYNLSDTNAIARSSNTVQTEYKKMTVKILENDSSYKYQAILEWKKMPKVRSYDNLGIGFYQSVKASTITFNTYYCTSGGSCTTSTTYYPKITSTGVGATFKLPSSTSVTSIKSTLTAFISKNVSDATVVEQKAVADYAHATSTVTSSNAQNYSMDATGIHMTSGMVQYYDDISHVSTTINCNW